MVRCVIRTIAFSLIIIAIVFANSYASAMTVNELYNAPAVDINPQKLATIFRLGSDFTDLQREDVLQDIKGKVIIWTVPIYEIKRVKDGLYKIVAVGDDGFGCIITLTANSPEERKYIHSLKTGNRIQIKGILTGETTMRALDIAPAIIWDERFRQNQSYNTTQIKLTGCEHIPHAAPFKTITGFDENNKPIEFTIETDRVGEDCDSLQIGKKYNVYWQYEINILTKQPDVQVVKIIPKQ